VDDHKCAECHADIFHTTQATGMAQSFFAPDPSHMIESFPAEFSHSLSGQHFEMVQRDGRYVFRRFERDAQGQPIHIFEQRVDWILGSGHKSRTYLFQTPAGELYQLPLAWYSDDRQWGMAPGYDRPDHSGVTRLVRQECLFCHNAYPPGRLSDDVPGRSQTFPHDLPQGIGCQRCHGPGAEHIQAHRTGTTVTTDPIVNPRRLEPALRADVCDQCHLQPSVVIFGLRRLDRPVDSFQPGQALKDYLVPLDIVDARIPAEERFEINHHSHRLYQSVCFLQSPGQLDCLDCHNPHQRVAPDRREDHYRAACQTCHSADACVRPDRPELDRSNCVACHMPLRRTQDVVHVFATDHRITRHVESIESRLAPLKERDAEIDDLILTDPGQDASLSTVYRCLAGLRATRGQHRAAADQLAQVLQTAPVATIEPTLELAAARLALGEPDQALDLLEPWLARSSPNPRALELSGLAHQKLGTLSRAEEAFRQALGRDPTRSGAALGLGRVLLTRNQTEDAIAQLEITVRLHPVLSAAWYSLGDAHGRLRHWEAAARCYQQALAIEPGLNEAAWGLEQSLRQLGRTEEAQRYRDHAHSR